MQAYCQVMAAGSLACVACWVHAYVMMSHFMPAVACSGGTATLQAALCGRLTGASTEPAILVAAGRRGYEKVPCCP